MLNTLAGGIIAGRRLLHPREYAFWPMWATLTFPHRPTAKDLLLYAELFGENSAGQRDILILGATPELRDLAAEFGMRPTVVDISRAMLSGMLRFCHRAQAADEIWIHADWLLAELPERSFDIVAGDLSLRHIRPEHQENLLKKVSHLLRPEGRCIIRQHTINPLWRAKPYPEIFEATRQFPYEDKKYEAMGILLSRLLDRSTKNQRTAAEDTAANVKKYLSSGRMPFSYRLFLHEFLAKRLDNMRQLSSQTKEEIEKLFRRHFSVIDTKFDGSYPESGFYPIYLLEKI